MPRTDLPRRECKGRKKGSIGKSETRSPSPRRLRSIKFNPFHENCLHNSCPQCTAVAGRRLMMSRSGSLARRAKNSKGMGESAHGCRHGGVEGDGRRGRRPRQGGCRKRRNEPPFKILDFGCGPGRDLKTFAELGHIAIGLEGSPHLAVMARAHSGCEVWQQDFLKLDLPDNHFDGVFANAALFHVPSQELPRVLLELKASLKPGGVLFSPNPCGHNEEGWCQGRYGVYHDLDAWRRYMSVAGFVELSHYYRPASVPRERQPWLANVWRRLAS
jgi:SAM-dependent methyltransferase